MLIKSVTTFILGLLPTVFGQRPSEPRIGTRQGYESAKAGIGLPTDDSCQVLTSI